MRSTHRLNFLLQETRCRNAAKTEDSSIVCDGAGEEGEDPERSFFFYSILEDGSHSIVEIE